MWTDERVETLRKLWADGLSASQIAAQLGNVSRNAVIGKVHRLKLSGRGRTTAATPRVKKAATVSATPAQGRVVKTQVTRIVTATSGANALKVAFEAQPLMRHRPVEDVVVPIQRKLTLIQLTERTCKWPNGDPLSEDFNFCGAESAETGPYCTHHARIAFQPASERRRAR
ncbi:GcrA cell cycle regulator [Salmonella enterica subsp. enterica]|nr:GcrA cell cycle regulator [Salmonella enterica subsp. enterica]EBU8132086.1 GcrA cell cycle regulator [Salmonella enterica subsp. enterica serovar Java]MIL10106.1 GcrA cell cycle regulator [Salmonella enterica subsp. enterica serovar Enteritidis]